EEITDLLEWSAVLQCQTHQASDYIVERDQFGRTVRAFQAEKDFSGLIVIVHPQIERASAGDVDFLGDVVATVGEGKPLGHAACTMRSMVRLAAGGWLLPCLKGPFGDSRLFALPVSSLPVRATPLNS